MALARPGLEPLNEVSEDPAVSKGAEHLGQSLTRKVACNAPSTSEKFEQSKDLLRFNMK